MEKIKLNKWVIHKQRIEFQAIAAEEEKSRTNTKPIIKYQQISVRYVYSENLA